MIASGMFLVLGGVWLLLQTLVGDLPGRVLSWGRAAEKGRLGRPSSGEGEGGGMAPGGGAGGGGGGIGAS